MQILREEGGGGDSFDLFLNSCTLMFFFTFLVALSESGS